MCRLLFCVMLVGFAFAGVATLAPAEERKVEIAKQWSGSVENENLMKPECITSTEGFGAVWKAWNIKGEVPKVDFTKHLIVAVYSVGSKLDIAGAKLDDKGNLDVLGFGTRDILPGFRYVFGLVSREGVTTVNKKDLPNE